MMNMFNVDAWPRVKRGIRFLIKDSLVVFAALLLLEIALRLVAPQYSNVIYDEEFTGGYLRAMNANGYRGPAVPATLVEGEYRILGLGDSITFGTGVAAQSTWPLKLGEKLASHIDRTVTSINTGLAGYSLRDIEREYVEKWSAYRPSVAVLLVSNNMISLAWIRRDEKPQPPRNEEPPAAKAGIMRTVADLRRSVTCLAAPKFLKSWVELSRFRIGLSDHRLDPEAPYGAMLAMGWRQENLDPQIIEDAWVLFERDLLSLVKTLHSSGIRLYVTHAPARFMAFDQWMDNEKYVPLDALTIDPAARVRAICERHMIPYIDAVGPLREARSRISKQTGETPAMYVLMDYTHLDAHGQDAVADALAERIKADPQGR